MHGIQNLCTFVVLDIHLHVGYFGAVVLIYGQAKITQDRTLQPQALLDCCLLAENVKSSSVHVILVSHTQPTLKFFQSIVVDGFGRVEVTLIDLPLCRLLACATDVVAVVQDDWGLLVARCLKDEFINKTCESTMP